MTFSTGLTQGGRGALIPATRSADERVSLTAVVEAVAEIMEASNRGGIVDRALAARIGSQIQTAVAQAVVNGRISSGAELLGQPAFRTILSQHLATTGSAYTDEEARLSILDFMRRNANRTGADFANFVAQVLRGGGMGARTASFATASDSAGRGNYDELDLVALTSDPAMAGVLHEADRHGCGWIRSNREVLGLGHQAVAALVAVHFQRESFRLMREAGFTAREVVGYARYARERGIEDANRSARTVVETLNVLAGDDPRERERILALMKKHFDEPHNADAERTLQDELNRQTTRSEAQRRAVERFRRDHRLEQQLGAESRVTAEQHAERTQADIEKARQAHATAREVAKRSAQEAAGRRNASTAIREAETVAERRRVVSGAENDILGGPSTAMPGPDPTPGTATASPPVAVPPPSGSPIGPPRPAQAAPG
jgi:hypothetical protein